MPIEDRPRQSPPRQGPPDDLPELGSLAQQLAHADAQLRQWTAERQRLLAELDRLEQWGRAPRRFEEAGVKFAFIEGRELPQWDQVPEVAAELQQLADLKAQALAAGKVPIKRGNSYWRLSGND